MKSELKNKVISWIDAPQLPTADEVKKLRQQVMTAGDQPALSRALVQTEKGLENNANDPLKPLRLYLRQGGGEQSRVMELVMDEFELFPDQRRKILEKRLKSLEAELRESNDCRVEVKLQTSLAETRLKSLYNWQLVKKDES